MIQMIIKFLRRGDPPPFTGPHVHVNDGHVDVVVLDAGMVSGAPSIAFRLNLPEGGAVVFETSAKLFVTAARAIEAKYPALLD